MVLSMFRVAHLQDSALHQTQVRLVCRHCLNIWQVIAELILHSRGQVQRLVGDRCRTEASWMCFRSRKYPVGSPVVVVEQCSRMKWQLGVAAGKIASANKHVQIRYFVIGISDQSTNTLMYI